MATAKTNDAAPVALKLDKALGGFDYEDIHRLDCGAFWIDIRRAQESNKAFRVLAAKERRLLAKRSKLTPDAEFMTGSLEGDIKLCCACVLVDWSLCDDDGNPIPVERAQEVFATTRGQVLFFKVMQAARTEALFKRDTTEDLDAKN